MLEPEAILHDRYAIRSVLRRGASGTVYLADQTMFAGRKAIVKQMAPSEGQSPEALRQMVQRLGSLQHDGLPQVKDILEQDGSLFVVMDPVEGELLDTLLRSRTEPFSIAIAGPWMEDVLSVLDYLHRQTPPIVLHDLSPDGFVITREGRLRFIDVSIGAASPPAGERAGYAAPELQGGVPGDNSDIYSVGALMYALLTLRTPPPSMHRLFGSATLEAPSALNPRIGSELESVILTMMEPMAAKRPATVGDALAALQKALQAQNAPPKSPPLGTVVTPRRVPGGPSPASRPPAPTDELKIRRPAPGPAQGEPELRVKRPTADLRQPLLRLSPMQETSRTCEQCGTPVKSGAMCPRCLEQAQSTLVLQPRPPELPQEPPIPRSTTSTALGTTERRSLLSRLRREPQAPAQSGSITVGPPLLRKEGVAQWVRMRVISYSRPSLTFDAMDWLDIGEAVTLILTWQRDDVQLGRATLPLVVRSLLATPRYWRYTAELDGVPGPEIAEYLGVFEQHRSRERAARRHTRLPCKFRVTSSDLPGFNAISTDISEGGLALLTSGPVAVGRLVTLKLDFDDYRFTQPVACRNEVRWCLYGADGEFRIGTHLEQMAEEDLALLNSYLEVVHHQRVRWST